jgi:hypothetical protein
MICEFEKQTKDIKDPDMNKLIELLKKPNSKVAIVCDDGHVLAEESTAQGLLEQMIIYRDYDQEQDETDFHYTLEVYINNEEVYSYHHCTSFSDCLVEELSEAMIADQVSKLNASGREYYMYYMDAGCFATMNLIESIDDDALNMASEYMSDLLAWREDCSEAEHYINSARAELGTNRDELSELRLAQGKYNRSELMENYECLKNIQAIQRLVDGLEE